MHLKKSLTYVLVFALALAGIGAVWSVGAPKALAEPDVTMMEYPTNPVYDPLDTADKAYYPSVLYDADQFSSGNGFHSYYKMWYADAQGQYEAVTYSNDGINWSAPDQTTGIHASGYHAKILYIPGGYGAGPYYYKIWYWHSTVHDVPYTIDGIRTADSTDGVAWSNDTVITQNAGAQLVLSPDPGTGWNRGTYGPITIFYNPSPSNLGTNPFDYKFAMYFDGTTGGMESIGLGYSADGNTDWHLCGSTPVLDHGTPGQWDSDYVTAATVLKGDDGTWRMWYSGSGLSGGGNQGIGYATSSDGLSWTKDTDNPIYSIYQGVAWRNARCYTPSVLYSSTRFDGHGDGCHYKMWFTGEASATGNRTIGYAYSAEPILDLQKSANPSGTIKRGDTITYTLTASNTGTGSATGCTLTDAIPGYTDYVSNSTTLNGSPVADVGGASPLVGGMPVKSSGQPAGTIAVGSDAVVTFQVTVQNALPIGSPVLNSATLTADGQSPVPANCSNASGSPVITLQKSADPAATIKRGDTITYTLTAGNTGTDAAFGSKITDAIPANTSYVTNSTTLNGSTVPDVSGTSPLVGGMSVKSSGKPDGTIADGAQAVVTFQVIVQNSLPIGTAVSNSATLASDDLTPVQANFSNASASPIIGLQKSASPSGKIKRGDTITYTLTARNTGTDSAFGSEITDAIPANTDYVPNSTTLNGSPVSDVGGTTPLVAGMSVKSSGKPDGTIADDGHAVVTFRVRVRNALPIGSSVANSATLSADLLSPVQASCSNSSKSPLIALFKNGSPPGKVTRGQLLTYTIRARNDGDDAARGCKLTDSVPAYTAYVANSTTLNGSHVSDVGGTTPLVAGLQVNSRGKPAGTIAEGSQAVITYKVRVQNDLPANWPISSVATLSSDGLAPVKATYTNYGQVTRSITWYLAEGSTTWGFDCYVTIENPNDKAVHTRITYMTSHGPVAGGTFLLAPHSQGNVSPRDILGEDDFSTKVECLEGETIAVDRTMTWTGSGAASPEAHNSMGVTAPAKTWYLPEGSSNWGFETWLLIQNPNSTDAVCTLTYMIDGATPVTVDKTLPANSRQTFSMADDIGSHDASVKVDCSLPVIPERAMYRNDRRGGHDSIGTTSAAKDYFLAEGTTAWGFTTYVLVQNPNDTDTTVTVTYMTGAGPVPQASFTMPPNSRKTIRVNDSLSYRDFSTQVHGNKPIIAERAMYWDNGSGEAMHDSIGLSSPHLEFYLPDGETSNGRETWTLVQNPNSTAVTVEISYFTPTGHGNVTFTEIVPANSRKSYNMADRLPNSRAAIRVISKSAGKPVIVERSMYWNNRGVGTDTIGGYSD